jgi:tetratricopeptide (TPR) repeat protein
MTTAQAVRGFLDALGVPPRRIPAELDAQAGLYRSLLSGKRVLVVLDNARDADQVRPLLPGSPGCLVLVTSRSRLASLIAVDGAEPVALDVLSIEESRALLAQRLGAARIAAEPQAVDEVITRCARLPLALAVVAARAAVAPKLPLSTLAEQLRDSRDRLDKLSAGDETSDVRAVFSWSYDALTPPAARMFRLLGLHPGPDISAAATASLAGLPPAEAAPLLAQLAGAHLLTEHRPGRYLFHDLLRAYAAEKAHQVDSERERHDAVRRTLDHYLHTAVAAVRLLNPHREPIALEPPETGTTPELPTDINAALAWSDTEHRVLLAAVDHAAATGFDAHTWQLAWYLVTHLRRRGHWDDWAATQRAAVAAAGRLADPAVLTRAHRSLGDAYLALGRFDDADEQLRYALDRAAEVGDLTQRARTHHRFAHLHEVQGQYDKALDHAHQALDLDLTTGDQARQAAALNSIGWFHALLGDYEQTVYHCLRAIEIHEELGEQDNLAGTLDSLAYAYHHLGDYAQAIACYRRAIDLLHGLGDRFSEAATLNRLGDTHRDAGDEPAARSTYEHALRIFEDLAHPDAEKVRAKLA